MRTPGAFNAARIAAWRRSRVRSPQESSKRSAPAPLCFELRYRRSDIRLNRIDSQAVWTGFPEVG